MLSFFKETHTNKIIRSESLGKRTIIRFSNLFPESWAHEALLQWEKVRQRAEVKEKLSSVKKRLFLAHAVLQIEDKIFRVKVYSYRKRFWHILENSVYHSEAMRNFNTLLYLNSKNILSTRPLLLVEQCIGRIALESVLITEEIKPCLSYRSFLQTLDDDGERRKKFLKDLLSSAANLHNLHVYTSDLDKNILVKPLTDAGGGQYEIYYLDFDDVFFWRRLTLRRTSHFLRHFLGREISEKLGEAEIATLVDHYLKERGKQNWKGKIVEGLRR